LRGVVLFAVSAGVYGAEIGIGIRLWSTPTDAAALSLLLQLILAMYAIGLARAWELLGSSHRRGLVTSLLGLLRRRDGQPPRE
jgi:hypothetical protein